MHSKAKGLVRVPHILLPQCKLKGLCGNPITLNSPTVNEERARVDASQTSAEVESELGRAESSSRFAAIHMLLPCEPRVKSTQAAFPGLLKAPLWKQS